MCWPKTSSAFIIAAKPSHPEACHLDLSRDEAFGHHTGWMRFLANTSNENCGREDTTCSVFPPAGSLKAIHITQKSFSFYFPNPAHPNKFITVSSLAQLR